MKERLSAWVHLRSNATHVKYSDCYHSMTPGSARVEMSKGIILHLHEMNNSLDESPCTVIRMRRGKKASDCGGVRAAEVSSVYCRQQKWLVPQPFKI